MSDRLSTMQASRTEKLEALQQQNIEVYPQQVNRSHTIQAARHDDGLSVTIVGRIMAWRGHGKLQFVDIQDESGKIQLAFKADAMEAKSFENLHLLDLNDFVEVTGTTFTTKTGERTVQVQTYRIISKAIFPLPSLWYGLKDKEERFRKRYIDLLLNPNVKQTLDKRWAIERAIREFLWAQDYKEVETPVLQNLYGGTNARPFTTHLNALDIEMYLRVAPELYLKRLIVGGYERIFEIARNFRNEGMDQTHQPEFTMMELYEAYADYMRIMDLTEALFKHVAQAVNGSLQLKVEDKDVDLSGNWQRITVDEALQTYAGIDWNTITDDEIKAIIAKNHIEIPGVYSRDKALFLIFDHLVPEHLIQPTWVIDYPQEVSPLARAHRSKPGRVERFEGYIGGKEICDGWSEIVSSLEQRSRFENEQKNLKAGDAEAQPLDEDFLEALGHGCPPLGGIGIGIDRLVMFMTNTWAIREVIAFPLMRPTQSSKTQSNNNFRMSSELTKKIEGMSFAVTTIKNVSIERISESLERQKQHVVGNINHTVEEVGQLPTIQSYRTVFKKTKVWGDGRRPSPEALLRRIAQGKELYTVNTAVDAYNLAVIETGVSLGGFDASMVKLPVTLRLTQEGEVVQLLGDETPTQTKEGEVVYSDAEKLLTLDLNYRDNAVTGITTDTKDILLFADGAPGIEPEAVVSALKKGAEYIKQYCGGEVGEIQVIE